MSLNPSGREILDGLGLPGEPARVPHPDQKQFPNATTVHPAIAAYMGRRSEAFAIATSGAGKPMTYGAMKREAGK